MDVGENIAIFLPLGNRAGVGEVIVVEVETEETKDVLMIKAGPHDELTG